MLVHIPIDVAFDAGAYRDTIDKQSFTLRFDSDTSNVPVEITRCDPNDPKAEWHPAEAIVEMMAPRSWNRLMDRLRFSPADYCADPVEGDRRQQLVYAQLGVEEAR